MSVRPKKGSSADRKIALLSRKEALRQRRNRLGRVSTLRETGRRWLLQASSVHSPQVDLPLGHLRIINKSK